MSAATASAPGKAVPADLVTAFASGLDPDISPEAALFQVGALQKRGLAEMRMRDIVEKSINRSLLSFLGDTQINLFPLNRQLDTLSVTSTL